MIEWARHPIRAGTSCAALLVGEAPKEVLTRFAESPAGREQKPKLDWKPELDPDDTARRLETGYLTIR